MSDAGKGAAAGADGKGGVIDAKANSGAGDGKGGAGAADGKGGSVVDQALAGKGSADGKGGSADAGAGAAAAQKWPDDWRDQFAGGDEKKLALAKRYSTPDAAFNALMALRTRLDSGEFKKGLPANATEDEIAQYRKDNGIPDKADGYELPKGLPEKILDIDKPIIDAYLAGALKDNVPPAEVQRNLAFFYEAREQMAAQAAEADAQRKAENEDLLRQEWGGEFRGNIAGMKSFIVSQTSPEFFAELMTARMGNGNIVGNDATALKFLVQMMKEINPTATIVPNGEASLKGLNDRIAELEAMQRDEKTRKEYYRDEKYSKELLGLYSQRDKVNKANKAA
jgi:hypothetical protein